MPRGIPNSTLERPAPTEEISEEEIRSFEAQIIADEQSSADRLRAVHQRKYEVATPTEEAPDIRYNMYYAKCDRADCRDHPQQKGYIVHNVGTRGPGGAAQVADYVEHTHATTPLPEFGQFKHNNQAYHADRPNDIKEGLNSAEYNWRRPWGSFKEFFQNGGVHRMPLEQFIQCGFHLDEDLAAERWAEIRATVIHWCDYCPTRTRYFTEEAHLNSHCSVMHKAELAAQIQSRAMNKNIEAQTASINNMIGTLLNRPAEPNESELLQEMRRMQARLDELESRKGTPS